MLNPLLFVKRFRSSNRRVDGLHLLLCISNINRSRCQISIVLHRLLSRRRSRCWIVIHDGPNHVRSHLHSARSDRHQCWWSAVTPQVRLVLPAFTSGRLAEELHVYRDHSTTEEWKQTDLEAWAEEG